MLYMCKSMPKGCKENIGSASASNGYVNIGILAKTHISTSVIMSNHLVLIFIVLKRNSIYLPVISTKSATSSSPSSDSSS